MVQHLIHLSFFIDFLNKTPNMDQLQKWHRLIENTTLLFLIIVISINYILQYLISITLSRAKQISNYIYLISYLLYIQIIIIYKNLHS